MTAVAKEPTAKREEWDPYSVEASLFTGCIEKWRGPQRGLQTVFVPSVAVSPEAAGAETEKCLLPPLLSNLLTYRRRRCKKLQLRCLIGSKSLLHRWWGRRREGRRRRGKKEHRLANWLLRFIPYLHLRWHTFLSFALESSTKRKAGGAGRRFCKRH